MSQGYNCTYSDRTMNIMLLTLAVLVTYLNATLSGALVLDDMAQINTVQSSDSIMSLYQSINNQKYFRPLGFMSFYIDLKLLGGDLIITHFISIVLHACNSIMVYMLGLRLADNTGHPDRVAMVAAMLFALHPVNSETVVWLSARFDLLCCFFLLITLLLILKYSRTITVWSQIAIFTFFLCSLLTKESSLFFPLCMLVYFAVERRHIPLRNGMVTTAVLFLALFAYIMMRNGLTVHEAKMATTADVLAGSGFYIGKMIYPFPLNFAITSINVPLHLILLFSLYLPAMLLLLRRMPQSRLPIVLMTAALIPLLYAMAKDLPWVPYAERYLYIPMTGFTILTALAFAQITKRLTFFPILCILLMLGLPTIQRVNIWLDHAALWQDTIKKSPGFGTPHLMLASEYLYEEKITDARQQLAIARSKGITRQNAIMFANELDAEISKYENRFKPLKTRANFQGSL